MLIWKHAAQFLAAVLSLAISSTHSWAAPVENIRGATGRTSGSAQPPAHEVEKPPKPDMKSLSAEEVKVLISGNFVRHVLPGFVMSTVQFRQDGTFAYRRNMMDPLVAGNYTIRPDGRVCWRTSIGTSGCFAYFRSGTNLRVRVTHDGRQEEGVVAIEGQL